MGRTHHHHPRLYRTILHREFSRRSAISALADPPFSTSQALWPLRGPSLDPTSFFQAYLTAPVFLVCLVLAWVWKRGPMWLIPAHAIDLDVRLLAVLLFALHLLNPSWTDRPEIVVHR